MRAWSCLSRCRRLCRSEWESARSSCAPVYLVVVRRSRWSGMRFSQDAILRAGGKKCRGLTAEMGEEPENQGEDCADDQAGDDGEVDGGVLAAVDDVAGKTA